MIIKLPTKRGQRTKYKNSVFVKRAKILDGVKVINVAAVISNTTVVKQNTRAL